jgi:hypothetical protein
MTTYNNDNSGALFKNDKKRPDRQDPDYTGTAELAGVAYYVDAWVNDVKTQPGRKFLKLKFKPKAAPAVPAPKPAPAPDFVDDADIPF